MPIFLEAPKHNPGGPDGKGWNRLSLNAHMGPMANQCALQPRTWGNLREVKERGTVHARWGNFGRCTSDGNCGSCPMLTDRKPWTMGAFGDRVLVRFLERLNEKGDVVRTELWLMNREEDGWASFGYPKTWEDLDRLAGWKVGPRYTDEHSDGFWLLKEDPNTVDGRRSPCPHEYLNPDHCAQCRIR